MRLAGCRCAPPDRTAFCRTACTAVPLTAAGTARRPPRRSSTPSESSLRRSPPTCGWTPVSAECRVQCSSSVCLQAANRWQQQSAHGVSSVDCRLSAVPLALLLRPHLHAAVAVAPCACRRRVRVPRRPLHDQPGPCHCAHARRLGEVVDRAALPPAIVGGGAAATSVWLVQRPTSVSRVPRSRVVNILVENCALAILTV